MIIGEAQTDDGPLLFIGLSRHNVRLLTEGKPIFRNRKGPQGELLPSFLGAIAVMFGETEQAIYDELRRLDVVVPTTEIRGAPPPEADHG